jgi:hypothetical protein
MKTKTWYLEFSKKNGSGKKKNRPGKIVPWPQLKKYLKEKIYCHI